MQGRTLPKLHCEEKHGVPYNATFVERCPHLLCWTLGMQTSELYLAPTEHFLYAKHCSEGLQHLSYLILVTARSSRCSYYPHFADGKADTAKTKNLTKTTQLVSDRAGPRSQGVGLQNHMLRLRCDAGLQRGLRAIPEQVATHGPGAVLISLHILVSPCEAGINVSMCR